MWRTSLGEVSFAILTTEHSRAKDNVTAAFRADLIAYRAQDITTVVTMGKRICGHIAHIDVMSHRINAQGVAVCDLKLTV